MDYDLNKMRYWGEDRIFRLMLKYGINGSNNNFLKDFMKNIQRGPKFTSALGL